MNETEAAHGLFAPINAYPLFENALRRHYGRDFEAHQRKLGELLAPFTRMAAANPYAWFPIERSPAEIATAGPDNRYVGFPYTKYMNAIIRVNQSAALLLTSESRARQLGIEESRWVYLHGCADVNDHWYMTDRGELLLVSGNPVGRAARAGYGGDGHRRGERLRSVLLLSLGGPDRPGRARHSRGRSPTALGDRRPAVSRRAGKQLRDAFGGKHDAAAARPSGRTRSGYRQRLVRDQALHGSLFHQPAGDGIFARGSGRAAGEDRRRSSNPTLDPEPSGPGEVETYTVLFDRDGQPETGVVIGRVGSGDRFVAHTAGGRAVLEAMMAEDPIGRSGRVSREGDVNRFAFE